MSVKYWNGFQPNSTKGVYGFPLFASAEALVREIVKNYSEPNLTPEEIRSRALNGSDPLKQFSETCRAELDSMRGHL